MLRMMVMLLVLANALYFSWSHGYLAAYGFAPSAQAEPQRLAQQIRPDAMRVTSLNDARDARQTADKSGSASAPTAAAQAEPAGECLQAGVYNAEQSAALTAALASALPAGSWALESAIEPARWIVYMGRYADVDAAIKKRGELRGLGVASELVKGAPFSNSLSPGLSLGAYASEQEASAELSLVSRRGVKTAKVRQERAELRGQRLKLPTVSAALRSQLDGLKPQLAGKPLEACTA